MQVLENIRAGAVIRVSASSNVQNVKTTYSVDTAGSKVVSFGRFESREVREIQLILKKIQINLNLYRKLLP